MSRTKTSGEERRRYCFASVGESKYKVVRCKRIWPNWVPEIVEHCMENMSGVKR